MRNFCAKPPICSIVAGRHSKPAGNHSAGQILYAKYPQTRGFVFSLKPKDLANLGFRLAREAAPLIPGQAWPWGLPTKAPNRRKQPARRLQSTPLLAASGVWPANAGARRSIIPTRAQLDRPGGRQPSARARSAAKQSQGAPRRFLSAGRQWQNEHNSARNGLKINPGSMERNACADEDQLDAEIY